MRITETRKEMAHDSTLQRVGKNPRLHFWSTACPLSVGMGMPVVASTIVIGLPDHRVAAMPTENHSAQQIPVAVCTLAMRVRSICFTSSPNGVNGLGIEQTGDF